MRAAIQAVQALSQRTSLPIFFALVCLHHYSFEGLTRFLSVYRVSLLFAPPLHFYALFYPSSLSSKPPSCYGLGFLPQKRTRSTLCGDRQILTTRKGSS